MTTNQYKAIATAPLTGTERSWLHDLPQDNLVGATLMVTAELCRLQDELAQIKAALAEHAIEVPSRDTAPGEEEKKTQEAATGVVVQRILSELFRSNAGWTTVDPRVTDFFGQPSELRG
jgi:hypothetical protein